MLGGTRANKSIFKKNVLIDMAISGNRKPDNKTLLFNALRNYTNKASIAYDEQFAKKIKEIRPDWFSKSGEQIKEQVINYIKNNQKRPQCNSIVSKKIREYINPNHKNYDPQINVLIRTLRNDWFIDRTKERKNVLLKMAVSGKKRPNCLESLGRHLCIYVSKNHKYFDEEFAKKIKELRPDWFRAK